MRVAYGMLLANIVKIKTGIDMASPVSSKKQIIQSIKDKKSILVTVSSNPSVDELAAALGLTIFLNKLDKHATAIASGSIPSALDFLDPEKTFEATADSLRDFIIAIDKEKADHLRYKVDGDVVKIFITPYRTTITQDDLEFSQGDYNVEMVIALNVADSDDLDKALSSHGKILHDATVVTISTGGVKSSLGTIEWHEDKVSGVSEMVTEIIQELKTAKADLDEQIATALLTGIVASTERFSNDMTSSKVMTMSAELMASGANQQLIASKLQEGGEMPSAAERAPVDTPEAIDVPAEPEDNDPTKLSIDRSEVKAPEPQPAPVESVVEADGSMAIGHEREGSLDDVAKQVMEQSQEEAARLAEQQLSEMTQPATAEVPTVNNELEMATVQAELQPALGDLPVVAPTITQELEQATEQMTVDALPVVQPEIQNTITSKVAMPVDPLGVSPLVGGTLNATTEAAAEAKRDEIERDQNRTILTHGAPLASTYDPATAGNPPMNAAMSTQVEEAPVADIFAAPPASFSQDMNQVAGVNSDPLMQADAPSLATDDHQLAMADVQAALASAPVEPVATGMPSFAPAPVDDGLGGMPALPPMPDFGSLPPLPPAPVGVDMNTGLGLPPLPTAPVDPGVPQEFNPAQFQIPTQQ